MLKKKAIQKLGHTFGDPSILHVVFQSHTKIERSEAFGCKTTFG
jgi:hypothetical protein